MREKTQKSLFLLNIILFTSTLCVNFIYAEEVEKENNLKAYFIYNFTKFIEWPNIEKSETFNIAIIGENELENPLKVIASKKTIKDLKVKVLLLSKLKNLKDYHIIFISAKQSHKLPEIQNLLENKPVLIITEKKKMAIKGSGINFVILDNKVRFEINYSSLKKRGIKVNSNLLKLAVDIY